MVEFENRAAFVAVHASTARDVAADRVRPLFDGNPYRTFMK